MKAKMSPNQSGWPNMADMRRNGKVTHQEKPMRKYQRVFFTRSTSRLGSTLNT